MKRLWQWFLSLFNKQEHTQRPDPEPTPEYDNLLEQLVETYKRTNIEFDNLKEITLAQWLLESGRATSDLATKHFNFAGLKWRSEMVGYATDVVYEAHDGTERYCKFDSIESFIKGYWHFLSRSVYDGWKEHASDPEAFLKYIVNAGYCPDNGYVGKVLSLLSEAEIYFERSDEEDRRGNMDTDKPDDGGDYESYPEDEEKLWYPKAVRIEGKMRTRGNYRNGYPQGAVVHFTAGRSRKRKDGGNRNPVTHYERGVAGVKSAIDKGAYAYFVIDRDGNVFQNFPLNRWGYHAGESAWRGLSGSVSDELVGIEIQNAGGLKDYWKDGSGRKHNCPEGKLAAWFSRPDRGDKLFDKETECRYSKDDDNIQEGWYHKYSEEQEQALEELLIWMKRNNPDVFSLSFVLGHDEVAGKKGIGYSRKSDPGASLSMTMSKFREHLKKIYEDRYGE